MLKVKRVHIYSILILALAIHLTILNHINIFGAKPDLVLALVIFFGLFLGGRMGLESGLVAGFLEDILTLDIFWANTFILGITGLLAGALNTKFFKESKITQTLLVFGFTTFSMAIHFLVTSFFLKSPNLNLSDYFVNSIIATSIYTALISVPLYSKFIDLYGLKEKDEDLL